ncbi:hypothetical protein CENSYa_0744 [Cenarchaeum symbiosum A]|uniref:Uncharacterized protein n=1 Tax=Cenarchaeum symbiosum (strain A) TaxID=414004 RepID=A0RVL0_CENSY|nr:hypothetical protein CENSYa_0744 [Cenarchaeum symbiosum A]
MSRLRRLAGVILKIGARMPRPRLPRLRKGPRSPGGESAWDTFKAIVSKRMGAAALLMVLLGAPAAIIGYVVDGYNLAMGMAALLIMPGVVMLVMFWTTRVKVGSILCELDKIYGQLDPKSETPNMATNIRDMRAEMRTGFEKTRSAIKSESELTRSAIKSESELTRKVLGGIAETLKSMDKTLERMDGKLDRIPGLSEPDRPDP